MKITLPTIFSQWDGRWSSNFLGYNTVAPYTIYNYGCLITCLAMIGKYYGFDDTPASVNKDLKDNSGFVGGGLYVWGKYPSIRRGLIEKVVNTPAPLTDSQYSAIKEALSKGYPVMLQIDVNPKTVPTDMHYVLCIGYDEGDENNLTIADPLGGGVKSLKEYLGWYRPSMRKTIEQFCIYEGKVPAQSGALPPDFPDLVNKATKWDSTVQDPRVLNIKDRQSQNVPFEELVGFVDNIKRERDEARNTLSNIRQVDVDGHTVGYYITELGNRTEQVARLKDEKDQIQKSYDTYKAEVSKGTEVADAQRKADKALIESLQEKVEEQGKALGSANIEIEAQKKTISEKDKEILGLNDDVKKAQSQSVANMSVYDVLTLLVSKVVSTLKGTKLK